MDLQIIPKKLSGAVTPPPSKSQAHRLLIAAALSGGRSVLHGLADSQDIQATRRCLTALGAGMEDLPDGGLRIHGLGNSVVQAGPAPILDCGESGSTLRFLIPVALLVQGEASFTGRGRLMERPLKPYEDLFREKGVAWKLEDNVLTVNGGRGYDALALDSGAYRLPGNVSSQFFTGLLFALPLLNGDSILVSTTPLESRDYLEMTRQALAAAGVTTRWADENTLCVPGGQAYQPFTATAEADWSQAGFWYAADFLDSQVETRGLDPDSAQGDKVVSELYWKLARPGDAEIDVSGCPDLLPPLAVMAAVRSGTTCFTNAARLRMKESDRLATTAAALTALGGRAEEGPDFLTVRGGPLAGGTVDCANDHRIAMAAAIAATACSGPVTVLGAECVQKSYPDFWEVYKTLGGDIHVL
ncbi:3-phosphoshikimate 1-carboxyvinyltransferase [Oscillibacter valericigenes]|uniref:3-phosphoshikimate 1-carboxyvinyltransferase n=1 Tax=Oscillibacter valericigenes TaxID=351091 RepID=A0ABS2FVD9_9FIRM|nr:3-phosphoshikimate 1-carboxyvinyltransferase [Oscillibacter valericigenes]MBM6851288.1 3-phosphoshikimate 1-carboxyvinyltransferase [Oscillibacter valericigenes]